MESVKSIAETNFKMWLTTNTQVFTRKELLQILTVNLQVEGSTYGVSILSINSIMGKRDCDDSTFYRSYLFLRQYRESFSTVMQNLECMCMIFMVVHNFSRGSQSGSCLHQLQSQQPITHHSILGDPH